MIKCKMKYRMTKYHSYNQWLLHVFHVFFGIVKLCKYIGHDNVFSSRFFIFCFGFTFMSTTNDKFVVVVLVFVTKLKIEEQGERERKTVRVHKMNQHIDLIRVYNVYVCV